MSWVSYVGSAVATALVGVGVYSNLPSRLLLPAVQVELKHLADAPLSTIGGGKATQFLEAILLSSLKQDLDAAKIPLVAVVHENVKDEVEHFKKFFDGDVFLDTERRFYGPKERWMGLSLGILRWGVWSNIRRAKGKDVPGNLEGEGRLLGGVFVIGKGNQGILLEHREGEWGDVVDMDQVKAAITKIAKD